MLQRVLTDIALLPVQLSPKESRRVFLTGIKGFIGSHLANRLSLEGYKVYGIDNLSHPCEQFLNNEVKVHYGDIRYYHDIEDFISKADYVLHTAAQIHVDKSITNPQETVDVNVTGTLNVLEACRKYQKKMVYASSSEVYGSSKQKFMDESHPTNPQSPYAASKLAGERLCYSYWSTYGLDVSILRSFNTFGSYQSYDSYGGVIAIFTKAALEGKPLEIYGDGTQSRDYLWIDDAVEGYKLAMFNDLKGEPLNIGTGKTVSINQLAKTIKKLTNSKSEIVHAEPRPGEVQRLCAGIGKAEALGFKPSKDFEQNLALYIKGEVLRLGTKTYGQNEKPKIAYHWSRRGWEGFDGSA